MYHEWSSKFFVFFFYLFFYCFFIIFNIMIVIYCLAGLLAKAGKAGKNKKCEQRMYFCNPSEFFFFKFRGGWWLIFVFVLSVLPSIRGGEVIGAWFIAPRAVHILILSLLPWLQPRIKAVGPRQIMSGETQGEGKGKGLAGCTVIFYWIRTLWGKTLFLLNLW